MKMSRRGFLSLHWLKQPKENKGEENCNNCNCNCNRNKKPDRTGEEKGKENSGQDNDKKTK